ncbi:MAG: glycosyltransferase [Firmicutes bacterium]|nr:glycosyltransferase [Bacillota bacterium]
MSVVIPAFNAESTIRNAIASVLSQTYQHTEILVVDDGSSDGTSAVVNEFADERIRLLRHPSNMGPGAARNTGIQAAKGVWIALLDADDAWRQDRLAKFLDAADESGGECFLADDIQLCFDTDMGLSPWKSADISRKLTNWVELTDFLNAGAPALKPMIPVRHIKRHGLWFETGCRMGEDLEFVCHLFRTGLRLKFVREPMYLYRLMPGSLSSNPERLRELLAVYDRLLASSGFGEKERALLARLRNEVFQSLGFEPVRHALVRGSYGEAVGHLLRKPKLFGVLLRQLPKAFDYWLAARRVGGALR